MKAVLFDMDGVLCASEAISRQAATETMAKLYSITVDPDDFIPFTGTGEANFLGAFLGNSPIQNHPSLCPKQQLVCPIQLPCNAASSIHGLRHAMHCQPNLLRCRWSGPQVRGSI